MLKLRSLLGTMLTRIDNMRIEAMTERKLEPTPGWCERAISSAYLEQRGGAREGEPWQRTANMRVVPGKEGE